jgi:hypothetical protein
MERATPILTAACCAGSPASNRNLNNSRTRRMAILSVGIGPSKRRNPSVDEAPDPRASLPGSNRNPWRHHLGMGGAIRSEWVAASNRNG